MPKPSVRQIQEVVAIMSAEAVWSRIGDLIPQEIWDDLFERGLVVTKTMFPGSDPETVSTKAGFHFLEDFIRNLVAEASHAD
jgi:hypothetical protein